MAEDAHQALASTGPPAGLLPDARYEARTRRLGCGEALLLVTDGVTEALDADGRIEERLARAVARRRASGAQAICDQVMRLARTGPGPTVTGNAQDDRTVVVVTLEAA